MEEAEPEALLEIQSRFPPVPGGDQTRVQAVRSSSSCQMFMHHLSALNHPELSGLSEVVRGLYKAPSSMGLYLFAFSFFAVLLLLPHWCTFLCSNSILPFFLSLAPELLHLKGSAADVPITGCLKRSLCWATPPSLLAIWTSAPWALGPSCKRIWSCNPPLL